MKTPTITQQINEALARERQLDIATNPLLAIVEQRRAAAEEAKRGQHADHGGNALLDAVERRNQQQHTRGQVPNSK